MEATSSKTVLSAGILIKGILEADKDLVGVGIYPILAPEDSEMPSIIYRRSDLDSTSVKTGAPADSTYIEIEIWTDDYEVGINIAEKVRKALEGKQVVEPWKGLTMRSSQLVNAYENGTEDSLFVQYLKFKIKI